MIDSKADDALAESARSIVADISALVDHQPYADAGSLAVERLVLAGLRRVRADVFAEIHHHWEFRAKDEADFDAWLHDNIKDAEAKLT